MKGVVIDPVTELISEVTSPPKTYCLYFWHLEFVGEFPIFCRYGHIKWFFYVPIDAHLRRMGDLWQEAKDFVFELLVSLGL